MNDIVQDGLLVFLGAGISICAFILKGSIDRIQLINGMIFGLLHVWYFSRYTSMVLSQRFTTAMLTEIRKLSPGAQGTDSPEDLDAIRGLQLQCINTIYTENLKQIEGTLSDKLMEFSKFYPVEAFEIFGSSEVSRSIEAVKTVMHELAIISNAKNAENPSEQISQKDLDKSYSVIAGMIGSTSGADLEQTIRMLAWKSSTANWLKVRRKIAVINGAFDSGIDELAAAVFMRLKTAIEEQLAKEG